MRALSTPDRSFFLKNATIWLFFSMLVSQSYILLLLGSSVYTFHLYNIRLPFLLRRGRSDSPIKGYLEAFWANFPYFPSEAKIHFRAILN